MDIMFGCTACSKESYEIIPTMRILERLDELFAKNDLEGAGRILDYWAREAVKLGDERGRLEILNEQIGYFRRTGECKAALAVVEEAFALIEKLDLTEQLSSATVYLNGATTMKAFGRGAEAMAYYKKAYTIYNTNLPSNDYRLATYFNNVSSAYKDLGEYDNAISACNSALNILAESDRYLGEMAVTHINLAHIYYDRDNFDDRIYEHMDMAGELLMSKGNTHNGDFAFICSKCYPSFGFFGYFDLANKLRTLAESIYEGN